MILVPTYGYTGPYDHYIQNINRLQPAHAYNFFHTTHYWTISPVNLLPDRLPLDAGLTATTLPGYCTDL